MSDQGVTKEYADSQGRGPTRHVTVTLTEREAEQMAQGHPDTRALMSVRRKCNYALHLLRSEGIEAEPPFDRSLEMLNERWSMLSAHVENLIERVYALEGGDEPDDLHLQEFL
jgi:hypothetical protein